MEAKNCPHCEADLTAEPIPQEYIDAGYYGHATHYKREIGIEVRGVYDGVLFWQCPDCKGRWNRWPQGHHLYDIAEKHMLTEPVYF